MYQKILVGTDGSPTARIAERSATRLASAFGSRLTIVSAYNHSDAEAKRILSGSAEMVADRGVEAETLAERGNPADALIEVADRDLIDLIVVGNKGMSAGKRFLLGSVPDRVSHHSPADLLIIQTEHPRASGEFRRIIVGTDGSGTASDAVGKAAAWGSVLGAEVTVVHVGSPRMAEIVLRGVLDKLGEAKGINVLALEGDPAEIMCEVAQKQEVDLIVVGNKGMSGTKRFLLGSVPNTISHYAPCSVLIARTATKTFIELKDGEGGLVVAGDRKVAVFKDERGNVFAVSAKCPHMGCTVAWNESDRTWDCPCHGSRFSVEGEVVQGPATRPLGKVQI